jgi:8-oxo-dGTP diphosphatase
MKQRPQTRSALAFDRPLVSVDVVAFAVQDEALRVLLVRRPVSAEEPYPGRMALPGGFVDLALDADLHACAARKLAEKTGVATPYLEQLGSWGSADRDTRGWSATHAYIALVGGLHESGATAETAPGGVVESSWVQADEAARKRLAFDHADILAAALVRLRGKVEYTSLPAFLLDEPFTLPQLQRVYEVVLGRELDKSAFRRRMLDAGFLAEQGPVSGDSGRAAMGYRIRDRERATVFPRTFRSGE